MQHLFQEKSYTEVESIKKKINSYFLPFFGFVCIEIFSKSFTAPYRFPFFIVKSANLTVKNGKYFPFLTKSAINIVERKINVFRFYTKSATVPYYGNIMDLSFLKTI